MGCEELVQWIERTLSWDRAAQVVAILAGLVAVATFALNRRDRTRAAAASVFPIVERFKTLPLLGGVEGDEMTVVRIANASQLPVYGTRVMLFDWGSRKWLWKFKLTESVWTTDRVDGAMIQTIRPLSESDEVELKPVTFPSEEFLEYPPQVVIWFRDGFGRRWVRWPHGRLSRLRLSRR